VFETTASGQSPILEQAKVRNAIGLLEEFGTEPGLPDARPLKDKLWELRAGAHRLIYFAHVGHSFVILHAFHKHTRTTPKQDLDLALRRMGEYR
jgi:phage-related protein